MLIGLILAFLSGSIIGLQNIFNNKVNVHMPAMVTSTIVLGLGFIASLLIGLLVEGKDFFTVKNIETWYWFSGIVGIGLIICVVKGIKHLGPTIAISIVMTSQLSVAIIIDSFGWFGIEKVPLTLNKVIGILVIIAGIMVFRIQKEKTDSNSENLTKQAANN